MSIELLMSAADAAGYVMATEDELPSSFGSKPTVFEFKAQPTTSIAIWRPVALAAGVSAPVQPHLNLNAAWGWIFGRFSGGALAG